MPIRTENLPKGQRPIDRARLLLLPLLAAAALPQPGLQADTAPPAGPGPQLQLESPCPFEAAAGLPPERVSCGRLSVPENRSRPGSAMLSLPVAVIHTTSAEAQPDPVIFIAGGPGGAPTASAPSYQLFASHAFNADRDVILYTQRGAEMTEPALDCTAIRSRGRVYLEDQTLEQRDQAIADAAVACLRELAAAGRDLEGYSVRENAQDLVDLRRALGLAQWNLLAVSYGTLIAIETARLDPDGVRSMVLDSLVSPESDVFMSQGNRNFALGLERLFAACAADADCHARFPAPNEQLLRLIEDLRNQPVTLPVSTGPGSEPLPMVVNWHDFLGVVHWMLYNAQTLTLVPLLIDETANGRYELLSVLLGRVFPGPMLTDSRAVGMFFATVCRDQWTARNPLPAASAHYEGYAMARFLERVCSDPALGYGHAPAPRAIASEVPTLLLSGRFDPITPDLNAEEVAAVFKNASLQRIPNFGHSTLSGYTACQTVLAKSFLDQPRNMDGFACLQDLPPPAFVLSMDEAQARFAAP